MVIYDMVIAIYAKKMQYIYIIIIHTHTGKTTHPQFSGHDGKKNATFSFCWYCLFTRQNGQSERMLQSYW